MSVMIKVGDRVKFLNDVGGGIVTGFIGKNMVNVENEDGFEVPYPVSKLINVDDPALQKGEIIADKPEKVEAIPPQEEKKLKGKIITGKDSPDFYFCIVPFNSKNPLGGDVDLYLVNDSNFTVLYHFAHYKNEIYYSVLNGKIEPNSKEELETLEQNNFAELPEYYFQLIYFRDQEKELHPAVSKKFKINPVKFYKEKSFQPNQFFKKNALVYQITENILNAEVDKLTDEDLKKVLKVKEKSSTEPNLPKKQQAEIIEIDLHIHELVDNSTGLSNKEILDIQMEKVEREMRAAIQARAKRIVFIHGVGQGVLKQEIAKLLKSRFPKYIYQDASFQEYGYGATMVILRRK